MRRRIAKFEELQLLNESLKPAAEAEAAAAALAEIAEELAASPSAPTSSCKRS